MSTATTAPANVDVDGVPPTPPQQPRSKGQAKSAQRLRNLSLQLGVLVLIIVLWVLAADNEWVSRALLPEPVDVLDSLQIGLIDGTWWSHIGVTLTETGLGFLIGTGLGLVVGALFAFVKVLRTAFYPYVIALMSFPKIAIAPLLIVAFGYDLTPKVIIATMLAFFPVMTAATAGLSAVDPDELNLMRAMQANRWQELRYLRLPNAMSYVFPSLDLALIGALLGAVAAELVGAQDGIGYLLAQGQAYGDTPGMFGLLIVLAILGSLMHVVVAIIQRVLPESIVPKPRQESK